MLHHRLLLLLLLYVPLSICAQSNIDSLKSELNGHDPDTNKATLLYNIGRAYNVQQQPDSSRKYITASLDLSRELEYAKGIEYALSLMGNLEWQKGNYKKAIEYHFESLKVSESRDNKKMAAGTYHNLANIYMNLNDTASAIPYFHKAIKLNTETDNKTWLSYNYIGLGAVYLDYKEPRAVEYIRKAQQIGMELRDTITLATCYINLGLHFLNVRNNDSAWFNFSSARKLYEPQNYVWGLVSAYLGLGNVCRERNLLDSAEYYYNKSLELSIATGNMEGKKAAYEYLAECDSAQGQFERAYHNYIRYIECRDSLVNEENTRKSVQMLMQHEFDKEQSVMQAKAEEELHQQKLVRNGFIAGFALMIALAFFIYRGYRIKQRSNVAIAQQKEIIEIKNKEILDSIHYAERIQKSLLASEAVIRKHFPEMFLLYKPKDIVSGDFYWGTEKDGRFYFAVCDSTGHGVPGAFMSLLNISFMNEAIVERNLVRPGEIFDHVRQRLTESFLNEENRDGMDGILLCLDRKNKLLTYAAAHNHPYAVYNGKREVLAADKMPVGKSLHEKSFTTNSISLERQGTIYLFTDGFADQFGGPKGKKFKVKNLHALLNEISARPIEQQQKLLEESFENWKGQLEQVDDVLIVGIRI